ncbi:MAG: transcription antitermination protein NusB [Bacteroidales bacterium]|nr:transcription antitermination protein NusB [Bacteroidales bacterium]
MISRTLIRVKAFKELYSRISTDSTAVESAEKEMLASLEKTRDLYCLLSLLPSALSLVALDKVNAQKSKYRPDAEKIEQLEKFVSNAVTVAVNSDSKFVNYCNNKGISWSNLEIPVIGLFANIEKREYYKKFINLPSPTQKDALNLFEKIYKEEIEGYSVMEDALEDSCIWWGDDLGYCLNLVLQKFRHNIKSKEIEIPQLFADKEDEDFAKKLVGSVMVNYDDLTEMISEKMKNWDMSRTVLSDMLIVAMGVAEAKTFPSIPLKVTIDEYVELSKHYSTPRSYAFVNGLLNKLLKEMYTNGEIVKNPKGMIGGID